MRVRVPELLVALEEREVVRRAEDVQALRHVAESLLHALGRRGLEWDRVERRPAHARYSLA